MSLVLLSFFNRERFLLPFVYLNLLGSFSMHIFFNEKLKSKLLNENGTLGHQEGSREKTQPRLTSSQEPMWWKEKNQVAL